MESKLVKDTTKEDHFVKVVAYFKIIYNQVQYLAYTEIPRKKRDVFLEIYIGRVSIVRDQYLLFKCETETEKNKVFSLFKKYFAGEQNEEIEVMDYSSIDKINIVSSNEFDEKMDQYPNFFPLPKKEEEVSASISLPSFLMKKKPVAPTAQAQEEIQFGNVGGNEILKPVEQVIEPVSQNPISVEKSEVGTTAVSDSISNANVEPKTNDGTEPMKSVAPKKKNKKVLIFLIIFLIVVVVGFIVAYVILLRPASADNNNQSNNNNESNIAPTTQKLICSITKTDENVVSLEERTFVFEVDSQNILTEQIKASYQYQGIDQYNNAKETFSSQEGSNTAGKTVSYLYHDEQLNFVRTENRNYKKALDSEKDDSWKNTYTEANEYYLNLGYTCNGKTKPKEEEANLTSFDGKNEVDYDNWLVQYEKAVFSSDKKTLTISLKVQNQADQSRIMNGKVKLYNSEKQNVRSAILNKEIGAKKEETISVVIPSDNLAQNAELGSLEEINLTTVVSYLVELYR